eukprot:561511_1
MSSQLYPEVFQVLNLDVSRSTITKDDFLHQTAANAQSYIVSDDDEELLLLIRFSQIVDLKFIKLHALAEHKSNTNEEPMDEPMSAPRTIDCFALESLNVNFNDFDEKKCDKSIVCSSSKLAKGQKIKLQQIPKFRKTRNLALYIKSNQDDVDKTFLNTLTFHGSPPKQKRLNVDSSSMLEDMVINLDGDKSRGKVYESTHATGTRKDVKTNGIRSSCNVDKSAEPNIDKKKEYYGIEYG